MAITRTGLDAHVRLRAWPWTEVRSAPWPGAALAGYGGAVFVLLAALITLSLLQDSPRTPFLAGQWGLIVLMLLLLVVTARIGVRMRTASGLTRRSLSPVLVTAVVEIAIVAGLLIAQQASGDRELGGSAGWAFVLTVPAFALAFLLGSIRARLFAAGALKKIAASLEHNTSPTPEQLEPILAGALEDPSLRLVQRAGQGGQWLVDVNQRPVELSVGADSEQCLTEIPDAGRRVSAILHDAALSHQPGLAPAVAALTSIALANDRLTEVINASQAELRDSRNRIQSAADTERRRIELNIHDGAQQRIVGLRIKLELARETLAEHGSEDANLLDGLSDETIGILDELRSLARGVYPPVLTLMGPEEALRAAARRSPIVVTLRSDHLPRYSQDVEAAVYFCCLEAMQNAAKHGTASTRVFVTLSHDPLCFEVRDDGPGFDPGDPSTGTGLIHLRDRLAALDGDLRIISAPGRGTRVLGMIPNARRYAPVDGMSPS